MNIMDFILNLPSVAVHFTSPLLLVFLVQTSAAGPFQVIGSPLPIVVAPGDDIILPCHVEPPCDVVDLTVEWSKPELRTDPNDRLRRAKYVHLYRDNREVPDMKMSSYVGRTSLFVDDLKQGNISLRVTNVTQEDEGQYRCFIPKLKGIQSSVVQLIVEQNFDQTASTETPFNPINLQTPEPLEERNLEGALSSQSRLILLSAVLVVAFSIGVGGYLYFRYRCKKTVPLREI
ncbi:myelin-oligodendrocyte glycoprotein [Austrofundulus limnaeus]|uniref:Myelin-oligodendrocyte glycoprotein n=1 Tax=Austrofundulus limnaeus TaxID=52670 RepID=A0A2I4C196_AUSLI|nr:PREDICTED: myelin-oligodendrocyte glycoprotein-like [Austrofundulus limnaeus]